jgi:hypothetical protein
MRPLQNYSLLSNALPRVSSSRRWRDLMFLTASLKSGTQGIVVGEFYFAARRQSSPEPAYFFSQRL